MKLLKDDWLAVGIFLAIFQVLCCWLIDVSVSAMINFPDSKLIGALTITSPAIMYHIGLYGIVVTTCFMILILLHNLLKEKKE